MVAQRRRRRERLTLVLGSVKFHLPSDAGRPSLTMLRHATYSSDISTALARTTTPRKQLDYVAGFLAAFSRCPGGRASDWPRTRIIRTLLSLRPELSSMRPGDALPRRARPCPRQSRCTSVAITLPPRDMARASFVQRGEMSPELLLLYGTICRQHDYVATFISSIRAWLLCAQIKSAAIGLLYHCIF